MAKKTTEKWNLDPHARGRTPNWVLVQTGCKTKAEIVAKYPRTKVFVREAA